MPPKRATSSASSSAASGSSGSSSSGSSSSSSGSSSSSSGDDSDDDSSSDDSDSSASQTSKKSQRSRSASASSAASSLGKKSSKKSSKKAAGIATGMATRSASSASDSDAAAGSKKKQSSSSKKSKKSSKSSSSQLARKVAPKKSATAKPVPKPTALPKKQAPPLSDNESEDSDFGDFSLSKFSAAAKQAKKAASGSMASTASSSSASNTPNPAIAAPVPVAPTASSSSTQPPPAKPPTKTATAKATANVKGKLVAGSAAAAASTSAASSINKYKSIFSESEDSDNKLSKKKAMSKRSPSPPKLTPQKKSQQQAAVAAAAKASTSKQKGPTSSSALQKKKTPVAAAAAALPVTKKVTRSSSLSSEASSETSRSSNLSRSSSDSSDSEVKFGNNAMDARKVAAAAKKKSASKTSAASLSVGGARKKTSAAIAKKGPIGGGGGLSTDSEGGKAIRPTTRQSRGGAPRRSKHITGRTVASADSESETDGGMGGGGGGTSAHGGRSSSPKKKNKKPSGNLAYAQNGGSVQLPPVRRDLEGLLPIETRKCPVPGCDSSGHLGGRLDTHFLQDACPVYHNINRKDCRDFRQELNKRMAVRKKALTVLVTKSPLQAATSEQKKHAQKIKDSRSTHRLAELPSVGTGVEEHSDEREVDLRPFASDWDIKLFREAQSLASEDMESSLKGLPDTKTTKYIEMGKYEMEVWYQSPYPEDYTCLPRMFLCEFCLKYMKSATVLRRHAAKCVWKHPPGDEIYRKDKISVFEICGKRYKQYCQSLCLLAKFFLDHKTLYFDVEPFLFYVMTTADSEGCHFVGYFSKEKNSFQNYNVSCILTLPCYQRQGYGRLLIDFSYLLSRVENKIGSPEKPLSDLGLITYRSYWKDVILEYICNYPEKELSIKNFSEEMGINSYDIVSTLQYLGMIKYWKGQHVILKKEDLIEDYMRKTSSRPKGRQIHEGALRWRPYEPSAKERRHAEKIKKSQEERQKKR